MRIFFPNASINYPPTAGHNIHRFQVIKNFIELGHEVHTLLPDQNPLTIKHSKTPWGVLPPLRSADVLYCRVDFGPNPATNLTLPRTRWLVSSRTVVVWEFNSPLSYSPYAPREPARIDRSVAQLRRAAGRVDAAVCVTRQLADEARELLGIENTHVVQNGSDPEMFRRDLPPPNGYVKQPNRLNVVFIASGRESNHDIPLILAAGRRIADQNLPMDIHIFGRSSDLFPPDVGKPFYIHGPVSYLELPNYLAAMDVGLVLYRMYAEGLSSLKLFDYLASGCVPICSNSQPVREVLNGSGAGLVGDWDADTLTAALVNLHRDGEHLERMRHAGRELILREHSWRRIAEKTLGIIDNTARRKRFDQREIRSRTNSDESR